jgi:hypothetical protein
MFEVRQNPVIPNMISFRPVNTASSNQYGLRTKARKMLDKVTAPAVQASILSRYHLSVFAEYILYSPFETASQCATASV